MPETTTAATTASPPSGTLARNAFCLLAGQVGSTALSVIMTAVLGRWLGYAEFGIYFLVMSVSAFAYVFVEWGQIADLIRESVRRLEEASVLLGSALAFRAGIAVVAALLTTTVARLIGYGSRTEVLALLAVACGLPLAL